MFRGSIYTSGVSTSVMLGYIIPCLFCVESMLEPISVEWGLETGALPSPVSLAGSVVCLRGEVGGGGRGGGADIMEIWWR